MGCLCYIPLASLSGDLGKRLWIDRFSCSCCEYNIKTKTVLVQVTHEWLDLFQRPVVEDLDVTQQCLIHPV